MTEVLKLLVCGGRNYKDRAFLYCRLDFVKGCQGIDVIINGGARGADALSSEWADDRKIEKEIYLADWDKYGKAAGPIRNTLMLSKGPYAVAAFPGGAGTKDMISQAERAGIKVWRFGL